MTMTYLGVFPESTYIANKYQKHFVYHKWVKGRSVKYYEVIEIDNPYVNVPLNKQIINKLSTYSFI